MNPWVAGLGAFYLLCLGLGVLAVRRAPLVCAECEQLDCSGQCAATHHPQEGSQ